MFKIRVEAQMAFTKLTQLKNDNNNQFSSVFNWVITRVRQLLALATLWLIRIRGASRKRLRKTTRGSTMSAPAPTTNMAKPTQWINCNAVTSIPRMANDFTRSITRGLSLGRDNTG